MTPPGWEEAINTFFMWLLSTWIVVTFIIFTIAMFVVQQFQKAPKIWQIVLVGIATIIISTGGLYIWIFAI
jgi:hypothetical protein